MKKKDENFVTEHVFCLTIFKLKNVKKNLFEINDKKICQKFEWNFNDTSLKIHHENLVRLTFLYYMVKNNPSRCLKNIFKIL